jgi:hypothetical protein
VRTPVKHCRVLAESLGFLWDIGYRHDWEALSVWLEALDDGRDAKALDFGLDRHIRAVPVAWLSGFLGEHWQHERRPHAVVTDRRCPSWLRWYPGKPAILFPRLPAPCHDLTRQALLRLGRNTGCYSLERGFAGQQPHQGSGAQWHIRDGWITAWTFGVGGAVYSPKWYHT